jgi:hypothetical protein
MNHRRKKWGIFTAVLIAISLFFTLYRKTIELSRFSISGGRTIIIKYTSYSLFSAAVDSGSVRINIKYDAGAEYHFDHWYGYDSRLDPKFSLERTSDGRYMLSDKHSNFSWVFQ